LFWKSHKEKGPSLRGGGGGLRWSKYRKVAKHENQNWEMYFNKRKESRSDFTGFEKKRKVG